MQHVLRLLICVSHVCAVHGVVFHLVKTWTARSFSLVCFLNNSTLAICEHVQGSRLL